MIGVSAATMAQEVDDMYFNSKDRAKLNEVTATAMVQRYYQEDQQAVKTNPVNPSDSYSGRGVNPEYNAQYKNGTALVQNNPDYFLSNYQPKSVNSNLYNGGYNSYSNPYYGNSAFSNPYYGGMGMGYGYSPMGMGYGYSPYSSFYSPYSMFYSPYTSGLSMGMGYYSMYGMGSSMYYGMGYGMSYGMGYGMSPYGYGYGYNPYGTTVIINNADYNNGAVTGRRPMRTSALNNEYVGQTSGVATGRTQPGGRASSQNYYDNNWKNTASNLNSTRSSYYNDNNGNSNRSSWGGNGNGNNGGWGGGRSSSFDNGSRSSFGGGGGTFNGGGGGSSGGGGGGGHSRGR